MIPKPRKVSHHRTEKQTTTPKKQNKVTTGNQEIIRGVKSMQIFTVVVFKTSNSLNTDASESLLSGEEARAFGKKNNSTVVTIIFT